MGSVKEFFSFHSAVTEQKTTGLFRNWNWLSIRLLTLLTGLATVSSPVQAQLIPDSSLGTESSLVTPQDVRDLIEGGAIRGNNLFHSFSEFNINDSQVVYFVNPTAIENILTRVTGNNISNILGTLGVEGAANLFLLNPNGILFGENAQLDLNGSFFATTGDSLVFENGFAFSATTPNSPPLLTVNLPLGVQYGSNVLGNLNNAGDLAVNSGQRLVFNGNEILNTGTLTAPEGQVELLGNEVTLGDGTGIEANLIRIQAENNLTIADQSNDQLLLRGKGGLVEMLAGGDVVMEDTLNDTIKTVGGNLAISGANIILGNVDTSFYETSGDEIIATVNVDAGGEITDATVDEETFAFEPGVSVFTFTVPELEDPIENLDVRFSAAHPWVSDLIVTLTSPGGTAFELFSHVGYGENFQDTLLNDASESNITEGFAPFNGTFRPQGEGGLAVFNGETTGGVWELTVENYWSDHPGTLYRAGETAPWGEAIGTQLIFRTPVVESGVNGAISLNATGGNIEVGNLNATSPLNIGGQIDLQATGEIGLRGTLAGHSDISVRANQGITLYDISSDSLDLGAGEGRIIFNADADGDGVGDFVMEDTIWDRIQTNGRDIEIKGTNLFTGIIDTTRLDGGDGGAITLSAGGNISTQSLNSSGGNGGDITIQSSSGQINLTNGGINSTSYAESGRGGDVLIQSSATDLNISAIQLIDTGIDAAAFGSSGKSGNITIEATNGGAIELLGRESFPIIFSDTFAYDESTRGQKIGGDTRIIGGNITIDNYQLNAVVRNGVVGDGGDIAITGSAVTLQNNTQVLTSTESNSQGNAGSIRITATDGAIHFINQVNVTGSTEGTGNAGNVLVEAINGGTVNLNNSILETSAKKDAIGNGGDINITAGLIQIDNNAKINASNDGQGAGGNVSLETLAQGSIFLNNSSQIITRLGRESLGNGGYIDIQAGLIQLNNNAQINARNSGAGNGGNVSLTAFNNGTLTLENGSNISTAVEPSGTGVGGSIEINTGLLSLLSGSRLEASTQGQGNAGNISIQATDSVIVSGMSEYDITSAILTSTEKAESGQGGNISISSPDGYLDLLRVADGGVLTARTRSSQDGGNIDIKVERLEVTNGGQLSTSGFSSGTAGNITIEATDSILVSGQNASITVLDTSNNVEVNGVGVVDETEPNNSLTEAQNISFDLFSLAENPNIELSTDIPHISILGTGDGSFDYYAFNIQNAGSLGIFDIDAGENSLDTQIFLFDNAGNLVAQNDDADISSGGGGSSSFFESYLSYNFPSPGNYILGVGEYYSYLEGQTIEGTPIADGNSYTLHVSIDNSSINPNQGGNSGLFAQANGSGKGGNLTLNTSSLTVENGAQILASSTSGRGGNINLNSSNSVQVNQAEVSASTETGYAGNLAVNANHSVQLGGVNSGLFARATQGGNAGNLTINTGILTLNHGTEATVSSPNGQAGNLEVTAQSVFLNSGKLTADTAANEGANITLQLSDLLHLSNESLISANARETANGGNININADFIIALPSQGLEGSDIIANAVEGDGGRIAINANSIFGLQYREQQTSQNDITASSELGLEGVVEINTPDVDPSEGLVELPENVVDTSNLVAQSCSTGQTGIASQTSEFIITGRGGLPQNPNESLTSDFILADWVTLPESYSHSSIPVKTILTTETPVVEAQGWVVDSAGKILLTATPTTVSPHSAPQNTASCVAPPQG